MYSTTDEVWEVSWMGGVNGDRNLIREFDSHFDALNFALALEAEGCEPTIATYS